MTPTRAKDFFYRAFCFQTGAKGIFGAEKRFLGKIFKTP